MGFPTEESLKALLDDLSRQIKMKDVILKSEAVAAALRYAMCKSDYLTDEPKKKDDIDLLKELKSI